MGADAGPAQDPRRAWLLRLGAFVLVFVVLQSGYGAGRGSALERWVIHDLTVSSAAQVINWLWPEVGVRAEGARLKADGGGLNVLNGCEGTDVAFLLVAAMVVAPLAWRWRLLGLGVGLPLVFLLNQVRVVLLFHAFRDNRAWFDTLHGLVAPLALVLLVVMFFLAWQARFGAREPAGLAR